MSAPQSRERDPNKVKRIVVKYLESTGQPDLVLESVPGGTAGYFPFGDPGLPVGFRIFVDGTTKLIPACVVADIDLQL